MRIAQTKFECENGGRGEAGVRVSGSGIPLLVAVASSKMQCWVAGGGVKRNEICGVKIDEASVAIVEARIMATKNVCVVLGMRAAGGLH